MKKDAIPITRPSLDEQEELALVNVLRSGWLVQGPQVARFENSFAEFVGSKHALATSSCTTALHLALLSSGIGTGDEVIMPAFTFIATANAVEYLDASPIFVDIDLRTFTLDTEKLKQLLELKKSQGKPMPKAIIPVSLFGLCADMPTINSLARVYHLKVIEDAACGLGATREGRHAGTEASAGCFSFHPRKAVTTGEGGMIITDDDRMAATVRKLRDHGAAKTDLERHLQEGGSLLPKFDILGFNYRMTDLQGALGAVQMNKAREIIIQRRSAATYYSKLLEQIPDLKVPQSPKGFSHAYQSYVCLYKTDPLRQDHLKESERICRWNLERNRIMAHLERKGISVRQGTHAVHTLGYYQTKYNLQDHDYPNSFLADRLSIALPLFAGITKNEQERVVGELKRALKNISR